MSYSRNGLKRKILGALALGFFSLNAAMAAPSFQDAVNDYNSGHYARAAGTLNLLKAQYPRNGLVHYYIALCQQAMGHIPQAQAEYQIVISLGEPRLSSLAATGLAQLSGKRISGYGGSGVTASVGAAPSRGTSGSSSGGAAVAAGRVSKVLEFWAEW